MKKLLIRWAIMTGRHSILILLIIAASSSLLTAKDGYGQELDARKVILSLDIRNQYLPEVFKDIETKTGFRFFYNANSIDAGQRVSLVDVRCPLSSILKQLSDKSGLEFKQIGRHISVRATGPGRRPQSHPLHFLTYTGDVVPVRITGSHVLINVPGDTLIRGRVTDNEGMPLPGVTVQVNGANKGTVTDATGNFSLLVSGADSLIFSYVGYEQERVAVTGRKGMNIRMMPAFSGLNEVVVVGYGTQKKQDITSSVSQISGTELRRTPTANLQNALNGKLPGLFSQQRSGRPGSESAAQIYIRGVSTFTGNTQPLVLVDNVEYPYDQLFVIDPDEVESISILKDAAATSIYGIKGANGVILVTTRRGKSGEPVIHLKTQLGFQSPVHVLKTLDSYHSALLTDEADKNDGLAPMFTDEDLAAFKSGTDPYGHPDVNWYKTLFKPYTLLTDNNIDISGGTRRVQYFITLGYQYQNGLVRDIPYKGSDQVASGKTQVNTNFFSKRYKFRSNLDIQATHSLHFQLDITGTRLATNEPKFESGFGSLFRYEFAAPFIMPVYNPDGSFGYANPNWMVPPNKSNNMAAVYSLGGHTKTLNDFMDIHLSGDQKLDVVLSGLSAKASVAYSFTNIATRTLTRYQTSIPSYWYNPLDHSYLPRDPSVYTIPPYSLVYAGGTPVRDLNLQGSLDYQHAFGGHNVSGLVLFSQTSDMNGANPPSNFRGYTFRFTYNYKHKYLLEMSGAYNGSDRFVTQKRYQLFPALSLGWNLAREHFFRTAFPFIESFKFRGSYGWVGDDNIGGNQYLYEQVYDRDGNYSFGEYDNNINSIVEGTQGNMNVTWQTERKADVGFDFSVFNGKFSGSIDYFDNYRYNILTKRSTIPTYFGVSTANLPPVNIGKVSNKGFEIEITYRDMLGQVGLLVKTDISYAKNKILFKDEPDPKYPWEKGTGLPIGMFRQYEWLGYYESQKDIDTSAVPAGVVKPGYLKYKDLNGDGIINNDDEAYIGLPNLPNTNLGLTLGATYKGFTLNILLQSALHFDVYLGNGNAVPFKINLQPIHLGRWTPETADKATFPAMTTTFNGSYMNPDNRSTFWTTRGDYLRIRSVYFSYKIPGSLVNKLGMRDAEVFMNGYNLFTWSRFLKRWQFDPEISPGSGGYIYPTEKILNFGLSLTFK